MTFSACESMIFDNGSERSGVMEYCNLHTHSTFSDGSFSPTQIVAEGLRRKLRAVALANHNTVARLPEFLKAAKDTETEAIPGGRFLQATGIRRFILSVCFCGRSITGS